MKAKVFKEIRKVGQIVTEQDDESNPREWNLQFVLRDQQVIVMTMEEAIGHNKLTIAFLSNMQGWPECYPNWEWTADYKVCRPPLDLLEELYQYTISQCPEALYVNFYGSLDVGCK